MAAPAARSYRGAGLSSAAPACFYPPCSSSVPPCVSSTCSKAELAQLFTLRTDTQCDTADILQAAAAGPAGAAANLRRARQVAIAAAGSEGQDAAAKDAAAAAAEFADVSATCPDTPLRAAVEAGYVSFVHEDRSSQIQAAKAAAKGDVRAVSPPPPQQQQLQQQYAAVVEEEEEEEEAVEAAGGSASDLELEEDAE